LYDWRKQLRIDRSWRPWHHKSNHGSHRRQLTDTEERLIEEAVWERAARGGKTDRKLVRIVVRAVTLETRGSWIDICVSSIGNLMHRLHFTRRVAHVQRRHEVDSDAEAAFQADVAQILCDSGFDRSSVISNMDETAIHLHGGRNVTWAKVGADGG
jgi:hypothetical protein